MSRQTIAVTMFALGALAAGAALAAEDKKPMDDKVALEKC
jgi:hypothetical protein